MTRQPMFCVGDIVEHVHHPSWGHLTVTEMEVVYTAKDKDGVEDDLLERDLRLVARPRHGQPIDPLVGVIPLSRQEVAAILVEKKALEAKVETLKAFQEYMRSILDVCLTCNGTGTIEGLNVLQETTQWWCQDCMSWGLVLPKAVVGG